MRAFRSVVWGAAGVLAFAVAASSAGADGMRRGSFKDGPRPFSFTGFYFGSHVGNMETESRNVGAFINPDGPSLIIGGQIGYNYQISQLVLGVETDGTWVDTNSRALCGGGVGTLCELGVTRQGSVRGRVGFAWDRAHFYGTGGWAWAHVEGNAQLVPGIANRDSSDRGGPIWGGGIEVAYTRNIIMGLEFLRADFGRENHLYDVVYPVRMETDVLRVRVNYKF